MLIPETVELDALTNELLAETMLPFLQKTELNGYVVTMLNLILNCQLKEFIGLLNEKDEEVNGSENELYRINDSSAILQ